MSDSRLCIPSGPASCIACRSSLKPAFLRKPSSTSIAESTHAAYGATEAKRGATLTTASPKHHVEAWSSSSAAGAVAPASSVVAGAVGVTTIVCACDDACPPKRVPIQPRGSTLATSAALALAFKPRGGATGRFGGATFVTATNAATTTSAAMVSTFIEVKSDETSKRSRNCRARG